MAATPPLDGIKNSFLRGCAAGDFELVKQYIRLGWDLEDSLPDGTRAVHISTIYQHTNILNLLIRNGVSVSERVKSGMSALHFAAVAGWCDGIRILLDSGKANINAIDNTGITPLHNAAVCSRGDAIRLLVWRGASMDMEERHGLCPLRLAVQNGQTLAVKHLLLMGVNLHAKDSKGRSSLHIAAELGFVEIARALITYGADKKALNSERKTPIETMRQPYLRALMDVLT